MVEIVDMENSTYDKLCDANSSLVDMKNTIIIDSGASRHMISDRELFEDYVERSDIVVKVASGHELEVKGVGRVGLLTGVLMSHG